MQRNRIVWTGLAASAATGAAWGQLALETTGRIDEVTVYRGQALVTRVVETGAAGGLQEIVVGGLPQAVVPSSLYADAAPGVAVRSIRYRERPIDRDVREEVRALDERIEAVQRAARAGENESRLLAEQRAYLVQLEQFGGQTAVTELRSGVLDAETIKSLSEFIFAERARLAAAELAQQERARELAAELGQLQREREQLAGATARTVREAVMFVEIEGDRTRELRLRYLVNQATWDPSYTVRTDESHNGVTVEYYAAIQQLSGEDWGDVTMTLSTATASLVAKAPTLEPLTLALAAPAAQYSEADALTMRDDYAARKVQVEQQRQQSAAGERDARREEFDSELNELAANIWLLDATAAGRVSKRGGAGAGPEEAQLSVTYAIDERTSLPSRADRQQVQIAAIPMDADFYKVAAPALTAQVFDEARITNTSATVLLPGPVSTYVDGRFVGYGEAPLVAASESFTLGFGIDSSLRASRELVERSEEVQGGNRIVDLAYRLAVQNFGHEEVRVRLMDRMPTISGDDVRVTLLGGAEASLSPDPDYQRRDRRTGILRWDVVVAPAAIGADALAQEYEFRLEYDKQMSLAGLPVQGG